MKILRATIVCNVKCRNFIVKDRQTQEACST